MRNYIYDVKQLPEILNTERSTIHKLIKVLGITQNFDNWIWLELTEKDLGKQEKGSCFCTLL